MSGPIRLLPTQREGPLDPARDDFFVRVGAKLRQAREEVRLTQREFSVRSGIPQAHICEMESGNRYRMTLHPMTIAAGHLPCSLDFLCFEAPRLGYHEQRLRWLLHAYAQMAEAAQAVLVDMALELARLCPDGVQ